MSRPFSWGPRNCIGRHLTEIGLYLNLARIYQLFDVMVDPRTTDEMTEPKDVVVLEPVGESACILMSNRGRRSERMSARL